MTMPGIEAWKRERAEEIIATHSGGEGMALPILHALQDAFGCVPEEAVPMVAEALNLSRAEIHGIVTFYHDFPREAPGRHVLRLSRPQPRHSVAPDHTP